MPDSHKVRQVEAIANGTVIDHIPAAATMIVVSMLANDDDEVFIGQNLRSARVGRKGVVKIAGRELSDREASSLALIAPGASLSIIRDYKVVAKHMVPVPEVFEDVARCANPNCVTNHEQWPTKFDVIAKQPLRVRCRYCERGFAPSELEPT